MDVPIQILTSFDNTFLYCLVGARRVSARGRFATPQFYYYIYTFSFYNYKFVEEIAGAEGNNIYIYRNLYNKNGKIASQDLVGIDKNGRNLESQTAGCALVKASTSAMATAMSSSMR
jgi:hypothetical protein